MDEITCPHCHLAFRLEKQPSITAIRRKAQAARVKQNYINSWRFQRRAFGLSLQCLTWAQVGKRINRNAKSAANLATKYVVIYLPRRESFAGYNWIAKREWVNDAFSYRVSHRKH